MTVVEHVETSRPWDAIYPKGIDWRADIAVGTLPAMLDATVARFGDRPAFEFLGARMDWSEVGAKVDRIAAGLQEFGYAKGTRIALVLPNCPAYPIFFFAALKAGLTVVNCNPLYTERELDAQLRDAGAEIAVTLDLAVMYPKVEALIGKGVIGRLIVCSFAEMLPPVTRVLFRLFKRRDVTTVTFDDRHIAAHDLLKSGAHPAPVQIDPSHDIAVLQYTGGTTGVPKAAMLSHANLVANTVQGTLWFNNCVPGQERVLAVLPFFHVFALTTVLLYSVNTGQQIVMLPRFELKQAIRTITRMRPTMMPGVPTLFNAIAQFDGNADLSSIKSCISGGAPLPPEIKRAFETRTGCNLVEGYGLTESSPCACCNPAGGLNKTGSIGLPMPMTDVQLRDTTDPTRVVSAGERGELCIRGPQVMLGYWNRPDETEKTFIDGWLRTGDVATMDEDGYFYIVDRIKDVILAGGYNVYPRLIEDAAYRHPAVAECTVIGVPDPYRGETVKAFIVRKPGATLAEDDLITFLKTQLSPIEIPKQVEFRDSLPRTLIGKLSKKELVAEERAKRASTPEEKG